MDYSNLNVVDLSVIAILVMSGVLALVRGLVKEVVILAVWAGSVIITARLYPLAKVWMSSHVKSELGADAATALALFSLSLIILIPLGNLISSIIKGETLTAIDRSLGFVFGVVRGFLVACLLYLGATWVWAKPDDQPEMLRKAHCKPLLSYGAEIIKSVVPQEDLKKTEKEVKAVEQTGRTLKEMNDQLEVLSTPAPVPQNKNAPTYQNESRDNLNKLINEKGK